MNIMWLFRSTDDGYTPTEQVGFIQKSVLDMLNHVYENQLDVHQCYLDNWDKMSIFIMYLSQILYYEL